MRNLIRLVAGLLLAVAVGSAQALDAAANFSKSTLAAGIDSDDTSLTVQTGHGARFPTAPFNAILWNATDYADPADAYWANQCEVVRVTAVNTDTFTITRAQEGTTARSFNTGGKTYGIIYTLTAATLSDIAAQAPPAYTVVGPGASTTARRVPVFGNTTGTNLAESAVAIDSGGNITGVNDMEVAGALTVGDVYTPTLIVTNYISTPEHYAGAIVATNWLQIQAATGSRVAVFDANARVTNAAVTGLINGTGAAATLANVTNALGLTGSTSTYLRSDGTQATPSGGAETAGTVHSGGALTTDNALVRADGTTGTNIQSSVIVVGDDGALTGVGGLNATNVTVRDWLKMTNVTPDRLILVDANKYLTNVATAGLINGTGAAATLANVTNALGLTGSTSTYLRSDGTQVDPTTGSQPLDTDLTRIGGIGAGTVLDVIWRDSTGWTNAALNAIVHSDTAWASSWNGVTTNSPSKNAIYDWGHTFDVDDDGKVDVFDLATGLVGADSNGALIDVDTEAELETALGGINLLTSTEGGAAYQPLDTDLTRIGGIGAGTAGDLITRDANGWTNNSTVKIDASGNITGVGDLTITGTFTASEFDVSTIVVTNTISAATNYVGYAWVTNGINMANVTASRLAMFDGSKWLTNSTLVGTTAGSVLQGSAAGWVESAANPYQATNGVLTSLTTDSDILRLRDAVATSTHVMVADANGWTNKAPGSASGLQAYDADLNRLKDSVATQYHQLVADGTGWTNKVKPAIRGTVVVPNTITISGGAAATDVSLGTYFRITADASFTLSNPTNPTDGDRVVWEITQDATGSRVMTLDTKFAFGAEITAATLSTAANKKDFLTCFYNSSADKWYVVAFVTGY